MIGLGIFFGLTMLVSVFIQWETYVGEDTMWLTRISEFLGIENSSFDMLFGLHFLPIVCALIFIIGISLAKRHTAFRITALATSLLCFVIGVYNILFYLVISAEVNYIPGGGLWLFTSASLLSLIVSALIVFNKNLLEKKLFSKLMDQPN
ncbi:MAG TPA: hypothetical protein PLZ15_05470 [Melioribacteraceae bacterium]|nr:hypothetical protein [Melioribacteraceae bacterium]